MKYYLSLCHDNIEKEIQEYGNPEDALQALQDFRGVNGHTLRISPHSNQPNALRQLGCAENCWLMDRAKADAEMSLDFDC